MKKIIEPARSVEVVLETDVLVVGSGPGGLAAALAAARAGARTALIDRNGCFGGNITQVGVEGFAWYRHEHTVDCEGIGIELEERAKAMGAAMPEPQSLSHALDAEMFKWVADVLVQEAGVTPLLHRLCVAPIMENGAIRGVFTESKAGREAILAKRVIDATGDADIAFRAGAPVHKSLKQEMMAVSVMFSMSGVNKRSFIEAVKADPQTYADWSGNGEWDYETTGKEDKLFSPFLRKPFKQALAAGIIPPSLHTIAGTWGTVTDQGDLTYLNLVHVPEIDGTDPNDLTVGEMRGRREAIYALQALRGFMPGCENARLRNFGMTLGIRDTRKIDALYNLTGTDVREQGRFDDAIGIFPEFIDGYGILILPTTGRYWHVPYRALVPKGIGSLLVAGRCIGGDKVSHASARNMMCCAVSGQGAGVAAAVSLQRDEALDQLNIGALQKELARQGVRFR
ncbi:MAG: FAD-dependent oxidoreductase [Gammaproteobacteria bacterium]|nr:MAG: FAD-dependent oxidoreductase [Gammaproteobacteria bacterium]